MKINLKSINYEQSSGRQIYSHTGLRGIAALAVFFCHINFELSHQWQLDARAFTFFWWAGYAVDLFFIQSGFILNWVYLSAKTGVVWSSYFKARVGRIVPLYYLTLALYLPIPVYSILKNGLKYVGNDYPSTLLENLVMVSGILNGYHTTINSPAWSISVEFLCYLALFPILVHFYQYLEAKRYELIISLLIVIFSIRLLALSYRAIPISIYHWHWDSQFLARGFFGFLAGFSLCAIYSSSTRWNPPIALIDIIILSAIIVLVFTQLHILPPHLLIYALPFLVYFSAFDQGIFANFFKLTTFQWLGERSYSIYLWHMPIIAGFPIVAKWMCRHLFNTSSPLGWPNCFVLIAVVLAISELSFRYFETPCREYIRSLGCKHHPSPCNP